MSIIYSDGTPCGRAEPNANGGADVYDMQNNWITSINADYPANLMEEAAFLVRALVQGEKRALRAMLARDALLWTQEHGDIECVPMGMTGKQYQTLAAARHVERMLGL